MTTPDYTELRAREVLAGIVETDGYTERAKYLRKSGVGGADIDLAIRAMLAFVPTLLSEIEALRQRVAELEAYRDTVSAFSRKDEA
jgi:hypothetical protein